MKHLAKRLVKVLVRCPKRIATDSSADIYPYNFFGAHIGGDVWLFLVQGAFRVDVSPSVSIA
jgi:hypothetical protein